MLKKFTLALCTLILLCGAARAADTYQAGKQYQIVPAIPNGLESTQKGVVNVTEFFSYGCHACYLLEPYLEKWLKNKPSNVEFTRVPVLFYPQWLPLAKAYYIAEKLGVTDKVNMKIFAAVKGGNLLDSEEKMQRLFVAAGVKPDAFKQAYSFTPEIMQQIAQFEYYMRSYKVYSTPTLIINGKYRTDMAMAGGPEKLLKVLNALLRAEGVAIADNPLQQAT